MINIAVLISGGGTNLQALLDAERDGIITQGCIKLVVADRKSAGGLARAEQAGVSCALISRKQPERLMDTLREHQIDFIVLSGYLSILPEALIDLYRGKIINIHPALTPLFCGKGFYGIHVHKAVLESGMKVTGVTVHFADEGIDTGAIISQRAVSVLPDDTPESLQQRVLVTEHVLLVETVKAWTEGRVRVEDRRAWIED